MSGLWEDWCGWRRASAQSEYNTRLRKVAPLMEAAPRWLADATPATAELLRLMDASLGARRGPSLTARHPG